MAIIYLDTEKAAGPSCPEWLEGWQPVYGHGLCHRDSDKGHLVGVCDPLLFSPPNNSRQWRDVDSRWKCAQIGREVNHGVLARDVLWCDVRPVKDLKEQAWMAPVILTEQGTRAFRVSYGANWLPELTPEQDRAERIAEAARDAMSGGGADMAVACQWAAELLSVTYHLHPQVFAALALLDDLLVPEVLGAACGLPLEKSVGN